MTKTVQKITSNKSTAILGSSSPNPRSTAGASPEAFAGVVKSSRVPLYLQLEAILRRQISTSELRPGDLIPSEAELGRLHRVSRITIRAALEHLVKDGLLERQAGRGTFVRAVTPEDWSCLASFTEQMLRAGRVPRTQLLKLEILRNDPDLEETLGCARGEEIVFLERLRTVDGKPTALVRSYIPHRFVPGISRAHFGETGIEQSILYVLERRFGLVVDEGQETTAPVCLYESDAGLLGLSDGSPAVCKACLVQNNASEPLLFEQAYWCAPQTELLRRRTVAWTGEL